MERFVLRIDIEGMDAEDSCDRPLNQNYLVCESDDAEVISNLFAELQNAITEINDWEDRRNKAGIEYVVFMWIEDDLFEAGEAEKELLEREEWNLGRYTNLKRAKKLMNQAIRIADKYLQIRQLLKGENNG